MRIVYYTSTYFLDIALEIINVLKKHVELHVFIEITPSSKNINIIDVDTLPSDKTLITPQELLSNDKYAELEPYLQGTASAHFVVHRHQSGFSYSTLQASFAVWNFIKPFRPDIIHFEGYTLRTVGLLPFLFSFKKVFLAIHDPVPHSGENSWKISLPNTLFFYLPFKRYFIFYSEFARQLFTDNYKRISAGKLLIRMLPYSYYKSLVKSEPVVSDKSPILFFGRISPYKGVDVLLKAMPAVLDQFPNQLLVIAGKANAGYKVNDNMPERYKKNILLMNRYIPNHELLTLISNAKFIVCPYLDATQSGVLMTAFALNKPVIASCVGSFPEFIDKGVNGLLVEPGNPASLSEKMIQALNGDFYKELEQNLTESNAVNGWETSMANVLKVYNE